MKSINKLVYPDITYQSQRGMSLFPEKKDVTSRISEFRRKPISCPRIVHRVDIASGFPDSVVNRFRKTAQFLGEARNGNKKRSGGLVKVYD
jgi:hypothetical protein